MHTSRVAQPSAASSSSRNATAEIGACERCGRPVGRRTTFVMEGERRCFRCALRYLPLLRRSLITAAIAGSFVITINQGAVIASGDLPLALFWKVPLTYSVPFGVATVSALMNARVRDT